MKLRDALKGPKEIYKGNKADHMRTIAGKVGDAPLAEMIFFDNEIGNCRDVAGAGATVVYTPEGLNRELFELGIKEFPKPGKILGPVGR